MPYCPRRKRRPAVRNAGRQGSAPCQEAPRGRQDMSVSSGHVPAGKLRASEAPAGKSRSSDGVAGDGERQEWRKGRVFPVCRLSCLSPGYFAVFPGESCRRRKRGGRKPSTDTEHRPYFGMSTGNPIEREDRHGGEPAMRPELCLQKHVFGEKQPAMRNACRSDVRGGLYGNRKGSVFYQRSLAGEVISEIFWMLIALSTKCRVSSYK